MFQHLDTVITFLVLMLFASLFVTAATQVVVSLLGLRGANLRRGLVDLFETVCPGQEARRWAKEIARRVLRHPAISDSIFAHFRLRADRIPFIPPETAGKLQGIGASIPLLPWILGAVGGSLVAPIAMATAKQWLPDACQYTDQLAGYVSMLNFCQHPWRTGALIGAILGGLLSRWRVATFIRMEELPLIFERLAEPLPGTLPDPAQRAMLLMAWSRNERGARSKLAAPQETGLVRSKSYSEESMVRRPLDRSSLPKEYPSAAEAFDEGIVRHAGPMEAETSVAVAIESASAAAKQPEPEPATTPAFISPASEPRPEVLRAWFDYVMDRASQRFAFQARLVTIALACIFVFAAHFDAVRLLQSMSQGAELRARLAATADTLDKHLDKHAEQLSHPKESAHTVVPDVYRNAMLSILRPAPAVAEPPKRKPRGKEREKVEATPAPVENPLTADAKSKAMHALETAPGFASREEAESWLRTTLDGNPARDTLAAAYQQEVNAELVSDSDKLMDQSASLKRELAGSEFKLFQDERPSPLSSAGVTGLLVTIAFLSLGAAFWYNTLKNLASLRPQWAGRPAMGDRLRKRGVHA